jgi:hypothetical protein
MRQVPKFVILPILAGLLVATTVAQVSVLTQHYDNARTGQNLQETLLTTANVNVTQFGKLFSRMVDGNVLAQPLYVPNLNVGGATHNVIFVATEHNSVYAFDADDPNASAALWQVNLGPSMPSSDICISAPQFLCPYTDLIPEIGITSTPVIDPSSNSIYMVAKTKDRTNDSYHYKLHALDITSGNEKFGGPVEIAASVPGTGDGGSTVSFNALTQMNRPGLLLLNGKVYVAFGSVGDVPTFRGWLMAYDAQTLAKVAVFCTTPNSWGGGMWSTGNGLNADAAGNLYVVTGNGGTFDVNTGGTDFGSAYIKLSADLSVLDYFAPSDVASLNTSNTDLSSGGVVLITESSGADKTLLAGGGKDGVLRVIDTGNMGKFNSSTNNNLQNFAGTNPPIFGSPVYWNSPNFGPVIYLWGPLDFLKAWSLNTTTSQFNTSPVSQANIQGVGATGGFTVNTAAASLSANGSTAGTGIFWAAAPFGNSGCNTQCEANPGPVPGALYAFDATDLTNELWDSQMNAARDAVGNWAKFSPPTIANGKVYLATFSGQLQVYGLNPPAITQITFVQSNFETPQTPTSSVTVPFKSPQAQGNLNVVVVGWNDTTTTVQSVTDHLGNQYVLAAGPIQGTGLSQAIYYAKDILAGSNSVIVNFSAAASFPDVRVLEYSGAHATNPLDVVASASGNSASANSGSASVNFANELIFGANTVSTAYLAAGSDFTPRVVTSPDSDLAEDRNVTAKGVYNASATLASSGPWVMQMATFKVSGSGGGGGSAPTVSSVSPNSGSTHGGTSVTISGSNFASDTKVTFGSTVARNVAVVNSTSITATTPAHAAGAVNVTVSDSKGRGVLRKGFTYTTSTVGISFVQAASATPQSPMSSVQVSYPNAQTAGDLNLVVVGWNDTSATVQSVTDSLGNTYALAIGPSQGTGLTQSIYFAKKILSGSNTVTVTFSQAAAFPDIRILEYKGLNTTVPLDVTAGASGTTGSNASVSSGAAATTSANELVFGAGITNGGFSTAGTSFTAELITADGDIAEDKVVSATGRYSATANLGAFGSQNWVMQMVALKH